VDLALPLALPVVVLLPWASNPTDEVEFELEVELDGRLLWASGVPGA